MSSNLHENQSEQWCPLQILPKAVTLMESPYTPLQLQPIVPSPMASVLVTSLYNSATAPLTLSTLAPAAASPSLLSGKSHHTPQAFLNCKLRSGKWIPEEDKYAELLIELFEKGLIAGCENGSTLRSYLSQKLHCAPMRISKKYAGKGIGKMVYLSTPKPGDNEQQQKDMLRRVKAAQDKFYHAVFLNSGASLVVRDLACVS
jgi:hypothetical protein